MRLANTAADNHRAMIGQQRPLVLPQRRGNGIAQFTLLHRAAILVIDHRIGIDQRRGLVIHGRHLASSRPDRTPLGMVVDNHAHIVALVMHIHMQLNGRSDVPLSLDHMTFGIQPQNIGGCQLAPGQLPGVGQIRSIIQPQRDVPRDMVVIALARQHSA